MTTTVAEKKQTGSPDAYEDPIVKKKKKKKKYSRGLRNLQKLEVAATKSRRRLVKAVDRGLSEWITTRDKSARRKKDGAIRDSLKNLNKSFRKASKIASKAPSDLVDGIVKMKLLKNLMR